MVICIALAILLFNQMGFSQELKSPSGFAVNIKRNVPPPIPVLPINSIISFYQNYLSQIKGTNCRMYPTCSIYCQQAIKKYKIKGVLISADRLHRCGHDLQFYNTVIVNNKIKYFDKIPITERK